MKIALLSLLLFCCTFWSMQGQTTNQGYPKSWLEKNLSTSIDYKIMPEFDLAKEQQADAVNDANKVGPWRFGYKHLVQYSLQNSGTWNNLADGSRIWRMGMYSKGALSMNLLLENVNLPEGASLYLYNPRTKELRGAYTSVNNNIDKLLGTTIVSGEELVLEYYEPQSVQGQGSLTVAAVIHGYRLMSSLPKEQLKGLNLSEDCNQDVKCPLGYGWQNPINSVALIVVNGNGICSGALINNTSNDGTPYFLSANHCGTNNLNNWVFRFNWDSPVARCAEVTPSQAPTMPYNEVNGSVLRANNAGSDFLLAEMNSLPTGNIFYAGWDRRSTPPTQTTGIHHPKGDVKKICRDDDPAVAGNHFRIAVWKVVDWEQGITEGGSSGSPLFNRNQLIVGQLYGGDAACVGTTNNGLDDNYGRFGVSWDGNAPNTRLKDWLDPMGTNNTTQVGYDPHGTVFALDAGILQVEGIENVYCNSDSIYPKVTLRNYGSTDITSVQILYNIDNAPSRVYNWTGVLPYQNGTLVTLPALAGVGGAHTFNVTTNLPNNGVDSNSTNNSASEVFTMFANGNFTEYSLVLDCYGSETSWTLDDAAGNTLHRGGPYNDNFSSIDTIRTNFCLPIGCYHFTIRDNMGDGLDGTGGVCNRVGDYWIRDASGNELVRMTAANGNFGTSTLHDFCVKRLQVDAINLNQGVAVFPNPAQDEVAVQLTLPQTEDVVVSLYNAMGQELQQIQRLGVNETLLELDLSKYSAGLYLVCLKVGKQVITKKIVKQ